MQKATKRTGVKATARKNACAVRFSAKLLSPKREGGKAGSWLFLRLPTAASKIMPSRGQVSIEGTFDGASFAATLEPDGEGGHWLKVEMKLLAAAGSAGGAGDSVTLEIAAVPPEREPEPVVPVELHSALQAASAKAREVWADITPAARRDFIQWITSAKQAATREKRLGVACDMLAKGKRRPCCFDKSGMYGKSMSCPIAEDA